ncbi:MAG: DUF433 domain-containing protein [Bacteroidota bacterium]
MAELHKDEKEIFPGITVMEGRRSGKPCVAGLRITVKDILGWLASGMTFEEITDDFPYVSEQNIKDALLYNAYKN